MIMHCVIRMYMKIDTNLLTYFRLEYIRDWLQL